jgi:hypothetical protein
MPRYDLVCPNGHEQLDVVHSIKEGHPACPTCNEPTETLWRTYNPMIAKDDIPGGVEIRHGLCHPDGTPKRYYSMTEIRRAANEKGLTMADDTPKPYKIHWSGRRTRGNDPD